MGSSSPKRRKLDHSGAEINSAEGQQKTEHELTLSEEQGNLPNATPTSKEPHARQKHAPNTDENALYAGGVYKSSLFKLQVDEMLAEVRPRAKRVGGVDEALHRLNSLIGSIQERQALPISEATKLFHQSHKITIPYPDPKPDKDALYKLSYAKPSSINVVGSYALNTMISSDSVSSVDMIVVMPRSTFQEKDFLNYRYFYKRSYYLACIAAGIQEIAGEEFPLRFEYLNENSLHPILIASLKSEKHNAKTEIRLIPVAPQNFFGETKLRPTKNSIRPKHEPESSSSALSPTPFYNASLKSDCNFELYLQLLHAASKQSNGFKDACILGKIWLRQRGFGGAMSKGGFGHFEWAALSALLLKGGGPKGHSILSAGYSSYQMFRAVVQFLATSNLTGQPRSYESSDFVPLKSDDPMFYDGPRGQNILYKMTPWSYAILREEAKTTIDMLDETAFDQFESTFIIRDDIPLQRYDSVVRIGVSEHAEETDSCDHRLHAATFKKRIFQVLREGFNDRVKLIDIRSAGLPSWSLKSPCPTAPTDLAVSVGVVFDPNNIDRLVEHGPSAEEKNKSAKFRKFWGEKAELRRFKDGSILESLVWSPGSTYSIFQDIFRYLVTYHFKEEVSGSLKFTGDGFAKILPGSGSNAKAFAPLKEAFNRLAMDIRNLERLPLQLRQLSPIDPQLRCSTVDTPHFGPRQPLQKPAEVLIQFEGSGRWPDDLVAIQRTKIALLLKIGSLLEEADDSASSRLGLEHEDSLFKNCAFLDIIYHSGAVFRIRIHNDREETLLIRNVKGQTTDHLTREDAVEALSIYKRIFRELPLHTQSIETNCTRFPLLSPTIRLTKMWFDRHMLSGQMNEELIELLVARTFLHSFPWRPPSSVMTGFLRTLFFISRWDWRTVPLIVDFNSTITSKEVASINTRLEAWRKIDPAMNRTVIFAASSHDMTDNALTSPGPSKLVAARMTSLARAACKLVKEQGPDLDPESLFASSTCDYDLVVHLSPKFTSKVVKRESSQQKFKNLEVQSEMDLESIAYQPVRMYLEELEKVFGDSVVFFYTAAGGIIAGLWNPQIVLPRPLKHNLAYTTKPASKGEMGDKVELDKAAILSEIARLGGDIVSRIEINR